MASDRFMVAIGYHGNSFHGSQIQPEVRTVEGSLRQALRRLTWWNDDCLEISSRTDAGVSVRANLARIDLPSSVSKQASKHSIIRALNDHLPVGAVALSACRVPSGSKVRYASSRKYLYRLEAIEEWPRKPDPEVIIEACSLIQGEHNFTNLSKIEGQRSPIRSVEECVPWCLDTGIPVGFSISARSFLWNQVRRVASALAGIASGRIAIHDLESALNSPDVPVDLGRAPSEGLVLWSIDHSDFSSPISSSVPDPSYFTRRPEGLREYRRWLTMASIEMSALLEKEWLIRLS